MEFGQIANFLNVAKYKSFSKAASAGFITQSAVSQQIKNLEKEIGIPLFERFGKRNIQLTEAGEKFHSFCKITINNYKNLIEEVDVIKNSSSGKLSIAAPFTTLYHLLPGVLTRYRSIYPDIEISVQDVSQKGVIEAVKSGEIDFGFVLESKIDENIAIIKWKKLEALLMTAGNHPLGKKKYVSLEEIARYPLILSSDPNNDDRVMLENRFIDKGINYNIVMETSNVELSSLYVELDIGISFATISRELDLISGRNIKFVPVRGISRYKTLTLILRKNKFVPAFKQEFIDTVMRT